MTTPEQDVVFEERLEQEVNHATRRLRAEIEETSRELTELRKMAKLISRVEGAIIAPPKWTRRPKSDRKHHAMAVAQLTDTHFDEVVRPEEILGINAYNRSIAERRLRVWTEKIQELVRGYVKGVEIDGLAILATGDLLSGDIHAELKQSNEDHLYASVIHWVEQLIAAIETLADEFGVVHVSAVVGNHGRSTIKPVFKGRAHSNIEWLLWRVVAGRLAHDSRITFMVSDSMDLPVRLYETNHVLTHGDQFHGGTGIAGVFSPLMLGYHRKGQRQSSAGIPMDIMVMGHFHQYLTLPGVIVGGSMKGYDEYAFGLNLRPEEAKQALWITTPEHGPTVHIPVLLQDRLAEGW